MVVAKIFNMFTSKLVKFSFSNVSKEIKRVERECLLINFTTRELCNQCLRAMEPLQQQMQLYLELDLVATKRWDSISKVPAH